MDGVMNPSLQSRFGPAIMLVTIILLPRIWVASQAVAPNKDAIRYWAAADLFVLNPPIEAIGSIDSLPVYPAILAFIKSAGWATTPDLWWRSSQLVGMGFYAVFLLSAYGAGTMMVGAHQSWWGCLLVAFLPRQIRYSVDILADNVLAAFLWLALAIWWWVMDRDRSSGWLLVVSILLGLAALTRPEAYLWIGVLLLVTFVAERGRSAKRSGLIVSITCLLAPLVVLIGSYTFVRGEIAPSNTGRAMLGVTTASESAGGTDLKTPFDEWVASNPKSFSSMAGASLIVFWEGAQETRVLLLLFFIFGIVGGGWNHRLIRWLMLLLLLGTLAMLFWCRWEVGFLTSRYFMPILPIIGFGAVAGMEKLIDQLSRGASRVTVARRVYVAAVVIAFLLAIPTLSQPMHADRSGHRQAANWLLAHTTAGEEVFDPSWVSAYFSGRPMSIPSADRAPRYGVIDASYVISPPAGLERAIELAVSGRVVAEFPKRSGSSVVGVRVYEMPATTEAQRESTKIR
jgi:hypothetical protein